MLLPSQQLFIKKSFGNFNWVSKGIIASVPHQCYQRHFAMTTTVPKPELPFKHDALEPYISNKTLSFHYDKHHMSYYTNLTNMLQKSEKKFNHLEHIVKEADQPIYNQAAQTWNHSFYWDSLKPTNGSERPSNPPTGKIAELIDRDFGSFDEFKKKFSAVASGTFGSGWAWLVKKGDKLEIMSTHDADCPLRDNRGQPILTCDVWEHAYYLDYQNNRGKYIEAWWALVNWDFANKNLAK